MYPRYEQYQDSGVAWLGEVPQHWEVIQFKRIVESVKDGTHGTYSRVSDGYPLLSAKNVFNHGLEIGKNESLITESDFQQITSNGFPRKNDLLITCVGSIGRCCVYEFDKPMAFQRSVAFLRLESKANPYFYRYFVLSSSYQEQLKANIKLSIQGGVYLNTLTSLIVYLPPLPEQTAIAAFLDCKLAQIDALISKQETLLTKLAEKRTALITHAVTRGLNPAAPLKPSGVAWLGEVPQHWEVKKGNQIFVIHNGATPKTSESDYWGDEIVWITPKDLGDCKAKEIGESAKMITQAGYENCGVSLAPPNSLALSKRAPIGHLAKTTVSAVVNQGCFLLEIQDNSSNSDYFYYLLTGYKDVLNSFGQGSTFMELPREKFAMLKMPFPPLAEQTAIADYLDTQTAQIDALSDKIRQTIARLQEYRRTLITQAVTGKIKVIGEHR